ncbi:MAG TPA: glycosyltransferase family 4 protein [Phycisphaerae bacterium]|nr:glycosyltransferase family 4 protein [Phycisphaerae bacterium]
MSIRLVHLVDENTREDAARLCTLLLRKLPTAEVSQRVIMMGTRPADLVVPEGVAVRQVARPRIWPFLWALPLQRQLRSDRPDAILAWHYAAGAAAGPEWVRALAAVVSDPDDARETSRWARAGGGGVLAEALAGMTQSGSDAFTGRSAFGSDASDVTPFICLNGTVRRRLVEAGVPMESTAVIRPGVDFAEIRRARESMNRERLGLPATGRVFLVPSPASRTGGQYYAAWATAILQHIWPDTRLIVPGLSREQRRIARLIESIGAGGVYFLPGERHSPAELLAVADALIVPALGDVPTGWIPWAMAAGVPIIGSAVPCVTEFIADRRNGFLCAPGEPHTLAVRIRTAFESPEAMATCVQTARHEAYETFRTEQCVQEFLKVIRNLAACRPALAGVQDAAIDA